jgi:hypothetical protein
MSIGCGPGGTYMFTFTRPGESPYVSMVTLPDPVTITSPADGAMLNRLFLCRIRKLYA